MNNESIPCALVSEEDLNWLEKQTPGIQQLWFECMRAEKTGEAFGRLDTSLSKNTFSLAKKTLNGYLFEFEPIWSISESGRHSIDGWKVRNLHGNTNHKYWEKVRVDNS